MKKAAWFTIVLICAACVPAAAFGMLPSTEIYGSVSFGGLLSGFQKDMPELLFYPPPDGNSAFVPMIGIRHFFAGVLGIEGSMGIFGSTTATWSASYEPLKLYDYQVVSLGLVLRYPVPISSDSAFAIYAGGGATYSILSLSTSLTSPFEALGYYFYDVKPDYGWYGKLGLGFYPSRHWFVDLTMCYITLNAKFDVSGRQLEGTYLLTAVTFGVAL